VTPDSEVLPQRRSMSDIASLYRGCENRYTLLSLSKDGYLPKIKRKIWQKSLELRFITVRESKTMVEDQFLALPENAKLA